MSSQLPVLDMQHLNGLSKAETASSNSHAIKAKAISKTALIKKTELVKEGETLPLFSRESNVDVNVSAVTGSYVNTNVATNPGEHSSHGRASPGKTTVDNNKRQARKSPNHRNQAITPTDQHMHTAWQLSKALKAVKSGRKIDGRRTHLSASQRHKVGNAICEHLLASLRQQVIAEQQQH